MGRAYLDGSRNAFHKLLLREGLEAAVDDRLVQLGLDLNMLRPDPYKA